MNYNDKETSIKKISSANKGEKNPNSKLTKENIKDIFTLYNNGYKQVTLSKDFHVSEAQISRILHSQEWII